ncbi:hypothetical protein ACLB2K_063799 [Fragaria x ananassa]
MWAPLVKKSGDPEIAEMTSLEEKAHSHSTILLCLADDIITEVAEEETAAGLWLKLESLYMTKSLTNKLLLKRRLFSLRMEEGTTLIDHLDQLNTILLELRNIDVKVDDEDATLIPLVSLPLSYENFVDSFISGRDTVTLEEVRSSLHTREMRHKATGSSSDSQAAGKFPKAIHRTKGTLDYIHSDCWGPSRVDSLGGHRYFMSMIDDYSRMTWVFVMKHKSDAFKNFKQWKALVENQTGKKIKRLRTDNGLEFCSIEFDELCKTEGIARHHTVRNTP